MSQAASTSHCQSRRCYVFDCAHKQQRTPDLGHSKPAGDGYNGSQTSTCLAQVDERALLAVRDGERIREIVVLDNE